MEWTVRIHDEEINCHPTIEYLLFSKPFWKINVIIVLFPKIRKKSKICLVKSVNEGNFIDQPNRVHKIKYSTNYAPNSKTNSDMR